MPFQLITETQLRAEVEALRTLSISEGRWLCIHIQGGEPASFFDDFHQNADLHVFGVRTTLRGLAKVMPFIPSHEGYVLLHPLLDPWTQVLESVQSMVRICTVSEEEFRKINDPRAGVQRLFLADEQAIEFDLDSDGSIPFKRGHG